MSIPPHGRGTHSTPTIYYLPSSPFLNPPSDNDRKLPNNRYSSLESPTKDTRSVGPIHIGLPSPIGKPQNNARGYWRDPETCYLSPPQCPQTPTISMLSKNYSCHLLSPSKPHQGSKSRLPTINLNGQPIYSPSEPSPLALDYIALLHMPRRLRPLAILASFIFIVVTVTFMFAIPQVAQLQVVDNWYSEPETLISRRLAEIRNHRSYVFVDRSSKEVA
ncbi:hypothetical protein IAS59_006141 [Cryptococcus gattii]